MAILELTDQDFDKEVIDSDIPVLVDFRADWCGPCRQIGPALEELSNELAGRVTISAIDVDANPNAPARYGVRGLPTLLIFKGGEMVADATGARPKAAIKKWIEDSI